MTAHAAPRAAGARKWDTPGQRGSRLLSGVVLAPQRRRIECAVQFAVVRTWWPRATRRILDGQCRQESAGQAEHRGDEDRLPETGEQDGGVEVGVPGDTRDDGQDGDGEQPG